MAHRRILTAGQRRALFDLPDDEGECRRRYALDDDDLRRIGRRRKPGNRLGFALQLCALRFPGRLLKPGETIPETIATANGPYGYFRQGEGWRMLWNGVQLKLFGTGPILSAGVEAGAFVNPRDPDAEPTIQAFCVPIVYLDRDTRSLVENTYGLTVTTVVVKPKSRGHVRLRSADPADMPLVSPNLLRDPDDMAAMIEGQRFFVRAFQNEPLKSRIKRLAIPDAGALDDESLARHCRRFVKTNYHPASTARMGADGDPMAVLDARMRVRGVGGLRVADMSAVPDISAGNTNAPAMMLGDRCAGFIMELNK